MPSPKNNTKAGKNKKDSKPAFDEAAFNQGLQQYNDAYAEAQGDSYTPPPGDYVCKLLDIRRDNYEPKEGKKGYGEKHFLANPVFQIESDLDGDTGLSGAVFSIFTSTVVMGQLKSRLAAINGETVDDLQLAIQEALGKVGNVYHVRVTENKKNPEYPNIKIVEQFESE